MYGAIIGDICGSIYEFNNFKTDSPGEIQLIDPNCFFTDDTVLICAVMETLLSKQNYKKAVYRWTNKYPKRGYGTGLFFGILLSFQNHTIAGETDSPCE